MSLPEMPYEGTPKSQEPQLPHDVAAALLHDIAATMDTTPFAFCEPPQGALGSATPQPEQKQPDIVDLLARFRAPGERMSASYAEGIVAQHLNEILDNLPRLHRLPTPEELSNAQDQLGETPFLLDQPITADALRQHVQKSSNSTPEIGIDIFDDRYVLLVGEWSEVPATRAWTFFQSHASSFAHTHPGQDFENRFPSLGDLDFTSSVNVPHIIVSASGLTLCPNIPSRNLTPPWEEYITEVRGFDKESFNAYGIWRVVEEYMNEVVKPTFVAWEDLDGSLTLNEITALMSGEPSQGKQNKQHEQ